MNATTAFQLSLRITHPSMDPHEISIALGLEPDVKHKVGERRKTPKGTILEGAYLHSYWSCRLQKDERLSNLISSANKILIEKLPFLTRLTETGGRLEYFIGCFVPPHVGDTLDSKLLKDCACLNVNLSFDMYGGGGGQ